MSRKKKKPLPQELIEVSITGLSHDGRGIARYQDKVLFVFGALPGEQVLAKLTHVHSRYSEAMTVEVVEPSSQRVSPDCPHFGVCGGCQLQHMAPTAQIEFKQTTLTEQLKHHDIQPSEWLAPLQASTQGYRQKARLGVRYVEKKQALLVGFREQKSNKLAWIESCTVLDPRVGLRIQALRTLIAGLEGRDSIAQIEVATTENEVALVFRHLIPMSEQDKNTITAFCQHHGFSFYVQPDGIESIAKIWPQGNVDSLTYSLPHQKLSYEFHPCDFTQVNAQINQKMVDQALTLLNIQPMDNLLDLFCGLGNFSLPLAQMAEKVVGIEGADSMVQRAKYNANRNALSNLEFYAADLSRDFSTHAWAKKQYNKILLDPPRSGAEQIVNHIHSWGAKSVLYISCNPITFVRDATILVHQKGYQLKKVGVMDMFPHTAHVEVMGLFERLR